MSTKIYHGMKTDITDIAKIRELVFEFKMDHVIPMTNELSSIGYVFLGLRALDALKCGLNPEVLKFNYNGFIFDGDVCNYLIEEWENKLNRRPRFLNSKFELGIHPLKDKTLLYPISNDKLTEEFSKLPWVDEYGYWNNTDMEEGVTEEEWEQRRKDWSFLNYRSICEQMFFIQLHETFIGLFHEHIDMENLDKYLNREVSLKALLKKHFCMELGVDEVELHHEVNKIIKDCLPSLPREPWEIGISSFSEVDQEIDLPSLMKGYIK